MEVLLVAMAEHPQVELSAVARLPVVRGEAAEATVGVGAKHSQRAEREQREKRERAPEHVPPLMARCRGRWTRLAA
jgi:hypothetical protein